MSTPNSNPTRTHVMAPAASTCWHNDMLTLSENIILQHAPALIACRRQLTTSANHDATDSPWLQQVDRFIDNVLDASGAHVNRSPEIAAAIKIMLPERSSYPRSSPPRRPIQIARVTSHACTIPTIDSVSNPSSATPPMRKPTLRFAGSAI